MMDQMLMQFCDQKHNAWPIDHTLLNKAIQVKTKTKINTRKRQEQEED